MPPTQERIAEFNSNIEAETVEVAEDSRDLEMSDDVVVGDDILKILSQQYKATIYISPSDGATSTFTQMLEVPSPVF